MLAPRRVALAGSVILALVGAGCQPDNFPSSPKPVVAHDCPSSGTLTLGTATSGDLGATACRYSEDNSRIQTFTLTLATATAVNFAVDATNGDFNPYLLLYRDSYGDVSGVIALGDGDPADATGTMTRLHTVLGAGTYVVAVNNFSTGYGRFTITAEQAGGSADNCVDPETQFPALWVTPGTSSAQTLSTTDCDVGGGQYADWIGVFLTKGQPVTFSTTSPTVDTGIIVYSGKTVVASDDNSGGGQNARASFTPAATGLYSFYVTAPAGSSGDYTLAVTSGSSAVVAGQGAMTTRVALPTLGVDAGARLARRAGRAKSIR